MINKILNFAKNKIMEQRVISKVWVDETHVYAVTTDGVVASYPIAQWPRLAAGTDAQRKDFYLTYGGIHWPQLDEDLSFEGMFHNAGHCPLTPTEDSVYFDALSQASLSSMASEPAPEER